MDKAIEILTESVKNYQIALESKFSSSKIKQIAAKKLKQHNEAIAELQELTQEKSCGGCYFIEERNPFFVEGNQPRYACRCPENFVKYVGKDFYCNCYTPKG